jgi:UDP-N-acetylglucosamine--N-acetylmuramyl-(pentapeptide) pyrophosphoryl-undecaprenol N-acetylglucosamine transferase
MSQQSKKILLAGGGSGGPVAPLMAVADEIRKIDPHAQFLFVGTKGGQENKIAQDRGMAFESIPAAKFRRYFSFSNVTDVFVFFYSMYQAHKLLRRYQPDLVFGAGSFVAVPISWMARLQRIPVVMHQQDAGIGLANKLIAPVADLITTAFEHTAKLFYSGSGVSDEELKPRAVWVGNPVRPEFFSPASPNAKQKFGLDDSLPVLLITGGATGAVQINEVVGDCMEELVKTHQVIHVTGVGKATHQFSHPAYHPYEFLSKDMPDAMKLADIVISRAGLSTVAELSVLGKIAIIVPMPDTHQEENGELVKEKAAAVVLGKEEFNAEQLPRIVTSLKFNVGRQKLLTENMRRLMPHDAAFRIAKLIYERIN